MMKIITLSLLTVFSCYSFAQSGGSGGGPRIFADAALVQEDGGTTNPYSGHLVMVTGGSGGGPAARIFGSDKPVLASGDNPLAIDIYANYLQDEDRGTLVRFNTEKPSLARAFNADLSVGVRFATGGEEKPNPFVIGGFGQASTDNSAALSRVDERKLRMRMAERFGVNFTSGSTARTNNQNAVAAAFEASEVKNYAYLGKVLDIETQDHRVWDRQALTDEKPKWMHEDSGNIWVKKDAPIINYQTEEGEVFEFKFRKPEDND